MKTRTTILIYLLASVGFLLMLASSCKKATSEDKSEIVRQVGDSYGGGIIFKIHWDGHYIYYIAATSDQSKSARWFQA